MSIVERMTSEGLRVDDTWWRIYEDSFPASEREPPEVILESTTRGVGMVFRARRQGVTFGLATTHLLKDPAAVFLVYLAVAGGERNRGAGGKLLNGAWESGSAQLRAEGLQPLGLIWEVDPPQPAAVDAIARQRRIAFFQRHGGQLLERPYLQPPVDGIAAVPMSLMFRSTEGEGTPTAGMVDALVRAVLYLYIGDKVKELRLHGINGVIELVALARLIEQSPAYAGGRAPAGTTGFSRFFEEVDPAQVIKDVAAVLGQSVDELKAFIYNMYYDPMVMFIYDVWGRYMDVKPFGREQPKEHTAGET